MTVGTAELRNRLSYFLRQVRRGARIVVMDRGEPVAELVPFDPADDLGQRIRGMVAAGMVTAEPVRKRAAVRRVALRRSNVLTSQIVSAMRSER